MCSCHVYALKLETAFRRGDCRPFSADEFEADFQGTLALGLSRLSAENLIEKSEINAWMEEYAFCGKKLREIVTDDENREVLEKLIRRLNILRHHRTIWRHVLRCLFRQSTTSFVRRYLKKPLCLGKKGVLPMSVAR